MRAITYYEHGTPEVLRLESVSLPEIGPDELLVSVAAAGINPIDMHLRSGKIGHGRFPMIPGSDFAGRVDEVGTDVTGFEPGDAVFGTGLDFSPCGTYSERAIVESNHVAKLPDGVSMRQGAAVGHVAVTAYQALFERADVTAADSCFIHGASGGVGHILAQFATLSGTEVYATVGSDEAERYISELGATHVFRYDDPDLARSISAKTSGVDIVVDHMTGRYAAVDTEIAAHDGDIVCLGGDAATVADAQQARDKSLTYHFMSMYNVEQMSKILRWTAQLVSDGSVVPQISGEYSLAEAPQAHAEMLSESFIGKELITM